MHLILARHGNTFESSDQAVWVGSSTDIPLTDKGRDQAVALGKALSSSKLDIAAAYSSPLKRATEHLEIAVSTAGINAPIKSDLRLNEIDYGGWEGLNDAQIREQCGEDQLSAWRDRSQWASDWVTAEKAFRTDTRDFVKELQSEHPLDSWILCVSSNGRLRYFLDAIEGAFIKTLKESGLAMRTGNIALLELTATSGKVQFWNQPPQELATFACTPSKGP